MTEIVPVVGNVVAPSPVSLLMVIVLLPATAVRRGCELATA